MSSHKYRKSQKSHVVLIIVAMMIMFLGVNSIVFSSGAKLIKISLMERVKSVCKDVLYVVQLFDDAANDEEQKRIVDYLEKKSDFVVVDAIYVLNEKNEMIDGFGDKTFDIEKKFEFDSIVFGSLEKETGLHFKRKFFILEDTNADSTIAYFVQRELKKSGITTEQIEHKDIDVEKLSVNLTDLIGKNSEVFISLPLWFGVPISNGETLLVRNTLNIFYSDIFVLYVFAMIVIVMLIPALIVMILVIITTVSQRRIEKILRSDPVTEGNSWMYFEQYASKVLTSRKNKTKLFAIVDITLLKYGSYCTFHGVSNGEKLLKSIDDKLDSFAKRQESSARYGKSSFAILLKCESKDECEKRVNDLVVDLTENVGHCKVVFHSGIYFIEMETNANGKIVCRKRRDIDEYYNRAAIARAAITDQNHSSVFTFDQRLRDEQIWVHKVEEKMQAALDNEEFKVYIQPKYNPTTEELSGAEALIRWINDEDGFISPGRFIPIFERNGFITKIDDYMISHIAKLQAEWLSKGKELVPISVNVSRAHFADPNLAEHICALIDEYEVPHEYIEIELTESAFFDDKDALLNTVHKLQEMGFEISMDDFGAGYSSLNSLKDLPLNVLKLDAEFFHGESGEGRGEIVVSQAIQLAKELNMKIVAEGIEKKDQVDFLAAHNCDMIQGFYFAKPMPANEYEERLKNK